MEHSVLVFTIWQIGLQEVDFASFFALMQICVKILQNGVFINWPWACIKHQYLTFFYFLEIWNKCVCVVWLGRWSSVSYHKVWKLLYRTYIAKKAGCDSCVGLSTCATFLLRIWVLTFSWFLSENSMCNNHCCVLLGNTDLIIIWGLPRHLWVFLIDPKSRPQATSLHKCHQKGFSLWEYQILLILAFTLLVFAMGAPFIPLFGIQ